MKLNTRKFRIDAAGAAGAAAGNKVLSFPTPAVIKAVRVDYTGQPATVDVTLENMGRTVVLNTNAGADVIVQPVVPATDPAGAAAPAGDDRWVPLIVHGDVTIAVAQGNAAAPAVEVTLFYE